MKAEIAMMEYMKAVSALAEAVEDAVTNNLNINGKIVLALSRLRTKESNIVKLIDILEQKIVKYN